MYIAPFVQSPPDVVDRMLTLAGIRPGNVLYDLGSGDGRVVITAAERYGIRAVGFEVDPDLVRESRVRIALAGLADLAEIREESVTTADPRPLTELRTPERHRPTLARWASRRPRCADAPPPC